MYLELTVNSDTDLVKLLWDTFPDWRESEIEELVDGGWVKVGDEIAHWGWLIYRGLSNTSLSAITGLNREMTPKLFLYETLDQLRYTNHSYNQIQIRQ